MSPFKGSSGSRAVALKYDESMNGAPIVVASGLGYVAEKIVEVASENNVPVFEDNSLSTVLSQLDLGAQIPDELYRAVVDIYVYFLNYLPGEKIGTNTKVQVNGGTSGGASGNSPEVGGAAAAAPNISLEVRPHKEKQASFSAPEQDSVQIMDWNDLENFDGE